MIDRLLMAVHAFVRRILISLSVDERWLPKYVNLSTNFRELLFRVEMAPSRLKQMYSILFAFAWKPVPPAACSRLCSRDSTLVGVFERNAISSA